MQSELFDWAPPAGAPTLRDYQLEALEELEAVLGQGKAPLYVAPTGSGKTIVAAELIRRAVSRGQAALFLAPRRELVFQTAEKLEALGVEHGLLLAGAEHRERPDAAVQVGSIDTILSRAVRRQCLELGRFDLVLVDEAHLSITRARIGLVERIGAGRRVGMTATPSRQDGRALGMLYDQLVETRTVAELTDAAHLVPARYFAPTTPDLRGVRVTAGDYNAGDLERVMNQPRLVGDVVEHWLRLGGGRRSVVFASSIEHSQALADAFVRAGVTAEHVDAGTPRLERQDAFARFRGGATQMLCNCYLASYGFDLPALSCVILARPTRSLVLFLQMLGRGLRPADGKQDCLVLDHAGAVHEHGFAADARTWTLDGHRALVSPPRRAREKAGEKLIDCPECAAVYAGTRTCPECGHTLKSAGRMVRTLDGELVELGAGQDADEQARLAFYCELRGYAVEKGKKPGSAAHAYRERHGSFPPWSWNRLAPIVPSIETRRWLHARALAYYRAREREQEAVRR